jgi:hypothetical protein
MDAHQSGDPLCGCGHHVRFHTRHAGCTRCDCHPNTPTESEPTMSHTGTTTHVHHLPDCDIHKYALNQPGIPAKYDKRTNTGQWGYVCEDHFKSDTDQRLGTGYGQELIIGEPPARDRRAEAQAAAKDGDFDGFMEAVGDGDPLDFL